MKTYVYSVYISDFFRAIYHLLLFIALDTAVAENYARVESIKAQTTDLQLQESFLEAVPQFILQLSIILRTGNTCKSKQYKDKYR